VTIPLGFITLVVVSLLSGSGDRQNAKAV